ncbi:unnamed protein product [Toxocara canis]|uniref:Piwi domain-containing protein n=1 Tax=Toxocara canis TaxID=6265 RepID=A0A183UVM1_TOXCA|nr:unnamed protein product [Toxocara canis]
MPVGRGRGINQNGKAKDRGSNVGGSRYFIVYYSLCVGAQMSAVNASRNRNQRLPAASNNASSKTSPGTEQVRKSSVFSKGDSRPGQASGRLAQQSEDHNPKILFGQHGTAVPDDFPVSSKKSNGMSFASAVDPAAQTANESAESLRQTHQRRLDGTQGCDQSSRSGDVVLPQASARSSSSNEGPSNSLSNRQKQQTISNGVSSAHGSAMRRGMGRGHVILDGEQPGSSGVRSRPSFGQDLSHPSVNKSDIPNLVAPIVNDSCVMAPKLPPAKVQQSVKLITNTFPLEIEDRLVYRYDVRVSAQSLSTGGRVIDLCRGSDTDRQRKCMLLLRLALERYGRAREMAYIYDLSSTLFTNEQLDLKEVSRITVEPSEMTPELRGLLGGNTRVLIEITECAEYAHSFNVRDFMSSVSNDLNVQDHSLRQFFEILTNQSALKEGTHYAFGSGRLFLKDGRRVGMPELDLGGGRRLVSGVDKGIRFIGGGGKSIVPALVLDSKKASFFDGIPLLDLTAEIWMGERGRPIPQLRGPNFNEFVRYVGFSVNDLLVRRSMSMKPFRISFLSKIPTGKIRVDLPAVVFQTRTGKAFFPMEILTVVPGQRVPLYKQTPYQTSEIIKQSVVKPDIRFKAIMRHMEALNLHEGGKRNEYLAAFGVRISNEPLKVDANRRALPTIGFSGKSFATVDRGKLNPVFSLYKIKTKFRDFATALCKEADRRGIVIETKPHIECVPYAELEEYFKLLEGDPRRPIFVMYIDRRDGSHDDLKLLEALYQVITQHVASSTMQTVPKKRQTLENIVNKMNLKNFGQNYIVVPEEFARNKWIGKGETLVIGYDVCHPESQPARDRRMGLPADQPSVIGISFNGARNAETFIGDYAYHEPRKEQVTGSILEERAFWMLKLFKKNRGHLPKLIIITRDGVSEGQFKMVMEEELEAIKAGVRNYAEYVNETAYEPKYVVIIATKRHNKRFFLEQENGYVGNTQPGTVVDHTVTRPDVTELFMQAHRVIQSMMIALCFTHQIVNSSISIPEPIFQADEWAKRGRNNFKAMKKKHNDTSWNVVSGVGDDGFQSSRPVGLSLDIAEC